jgi:hypothetical protein
MIRGLGRAPPPADGHIARRQPLKEEPAEAIEPGRPQFETAAWLYRMTLASPLGSIGETPPESGNFDTGGNDTTITSLKNRAPADPVSSSLIKLLSPQRLNRTSVLAVARRVVKNWTFLEPVEVLPDDDDPEPNGTGRDEAGGDRGADAHSVSAASDPDNYKDETSADEDSSDDGDLWDLIENQEIQPHGIQPRRRFTFKEYDQALESGDIHDTSNRSRNPVEKRSEEKSPDEVLFEKTSAKQSSRLDPDDEGENSSSFQVNEVYSESYASDASASESSQLSSRKPSRPRSRRRQKPAPKSSSRPGLRKTSPDDYPLPSTPAPKFDPIDPIPVASHASRTIPSPVFPYGHSSPPPQTPARQSLNATNDDTILKKLEALLAGRQDEQARQEAEARKAEQNTKFDRLESILLAQQEAQVAKEKSKEKADQKAATEQAAQRAEMRKMYHEDKLGRLEELILSQREEQFVREAAAETARRAEAKAAELVAIKAHQEKEAADALVDAVNQARNKSEKIAAEEMEKVRKAHEEALLEVQRTVKDMEDIIQEERRLREDAERIDAEHSVAAKVHLAASNLIDTMYGREEKKWYMTTNGPLCIDTSDGSIPRQLLSRAQQEEEETDEYRTTISSPDMNLLDLDQDEVAKVPESAQTLQSPGKYHLLFPPGTKQSMLQDTDMLTALQSSGIESLIELDTLQLRNNITYHDTQKDRGQGDTFIPASLLWQRLPAHGQSELYQSLCKIGWKPTYLRSSGK